MAEAGAISLVGRAFGLQVTVAGLLPVVAVAWVAPLLGSLIQTLLILALPLEAMNQVKVSLAAFLPPSPHPGVGYLLLDKINPFVIWNFVLLGLGTAAVARVDNRRGLAVVLVIWMVYVAVSIALSMAAMALNPAVH